MIDLNKYRWLKIEPVDAWFFRDGRPSNRGEDQSDLESEFPPNPPTIVGALRAGLARVNGWSGRDSWSKEAAELGKILGDGFDDLGQLTFLGPFLHKNDQVLWPLPRHVVGCSKAGRFHPEALLQPSTEPVCCDIGQDDVQLPALPPKPATDGRNDMPRKPPTYPEGMFVTTTGMNRILAGQVPRSDEIVPSNKLFTHESRIGILRDVESRTTGRNALYSPRYVRLKNGVSLVEGVTGIPDNWKLPSLMPLGGESRLAGVTALDGAPTVPSVGDVGGAIAISLAPACFHHPWWGAGPGDPASQLSAALSGDLISVALDRPRRIGGWDFSVSAPRPLLPFAPAGTVWWLEDTANNGCGVYQLGSSLNYGFGLTVVSAGRKTDKI